MKHFALLPLVLLAACTVPQAVSDAPAGATSSAHIQPDASRLAADVAWLADDAREGRRAGTSAAKEAGEWIAARMQQLGLERAGESGWLQDFTVPLEPRDGGSSGVVEVVAPGIPPSIMLGGADVSPLFCSGDALSEVGRPAEHPGHAEGPLVFCGYGIENEERGWNDYTGKDLRGAIALIVRGTPKLDKSEPPPAEGDTKLVAKSDGWGNSGSIFTKVMTAKRHGAIGVILAPEDPAELPLSFDAGRAGQAGIPAVMVSGESALRLHSNYVAELDPRLRKVVRGRSSVSIFADVVRESGPAYNVLGRLKGRDPSRCVVVGAHYDHLGHGGTGSLAPNAGAQIHNGADDNASGTATVLEIARLMKAAGTPPCDVIFALWSGEELGLLGSEHWAKKPTIPIECVVANLNLDMVGRAGNGKLQVLGAGTSPSFVEWMKAAGEASGLDLTVSTTGGAMGGSSDHQTFVKRKIPALHLFSGLHGDYHKPSDDADKFEAAGAAKVAVLGADLASRMAAAGRLEFVEPKAPEPKEGQTVKSGFRAWFGSMPSYSYDGKGVLIDGTSAGSPAERAGFLKGDILVGIGDVKIDTIYDFMYGLERYKPGDVVLVKFLRDGAEQEIRVTLSSRDLQ